jgi:D-alanyl-D-alanine carboxypeptidase
MTLYILFEKLDKNSISLNSKIVFSKYASSKPASKLGVQSNDSITVKEAIDAVIVLSANDVATALGEYLGGSEATFSRMMNLKAQKLKMYNTHFSNASGLFHPAQHTTAADIVRLGIALRNDFPQYYKYFTKTSFNFRGRTIQGHNSITKNYAGAEGLKTGYISQSGYNLVSSASRDKKTVFATVLGGKTASERDLYMRKLLDASFSKIDKNKVRL